MVSHAPKALLNTVSLTVGYMFCCGKAALGRARTRVAYAILVWRGMSLVHDCARLVIRPGKVTYMVLWP